MLKLEENINAEGYLPKGREKEIYDNVKKRMQQMEDFKTSEGVESKWRKADTMYPPHELTDPKIKDWMSRCSVPVAFEKVNTAHAVLNEKNPEAVFTAGANQYKGKELFIKGLFEHNEKVTFFRQTRSKFTHNLLKYGWAAGRIYIKEINGWEEPFAEVLNPYDVYVDDMARPFDETSIRDWYFKKNYQYEDLKKLYPQSEYPNMRFVIPGGETEETERTEKTTQHLIAVKFYENKNEDLFAIMANNVLLYYGELPYVHKRLSLFQCPLILRNTESIYGIGIPEQILPDQNLLDKIVNMSFNELVQRVGKIVLYTGTINRDQDFFDLEPGIAKQIPDTDKVLEIGGNVGNAVAEASKQIEMIEERQEKTTGIPKILAGEVLGKTATEARINRESGIRRLRTPLDHIKYVLEILGNLRMDLIQEYYQKPRIEKILSDREITDYLEEMQNNPFKFNQTEEGIERQEFRTIPMNIERKEQGKLRKFANRMTGKEDKVTYEASNETNAIEISPEEIKWQGEVTINVESVLLPSKELERLDVKEMFAMLIGLPDTDQRKSEKSLIKDGFDKDPNDYMISEEDALKRQKGEKEAEQAQADIAGSQAEMQNMQNMQQETETQI